MEQRLDQSRRVRVDQAGNQKPRSQSDQFRQTGFCKAFLPGRLHSFTNEVGGKDGCSQNVSGMGIGPEQRDWQKPEDLPTAVLLKNFKGVEKENEAEKCPKLRSLQPTTTGLNEDRRKKSKCG